MSDKQNTRKMDWIRQGNRKAVALIVAAVLTVGSVVGVQAIASSDTYQHIQLAAGYKSTWHGGGHGDRHKSFGDYSDAEIESRIERVVKHVAIEIDATPTQQEKIIALVAAAAKDLKPVHARMPTARKDIQELLTANTVDRAALEKLRAARLADAEMVSKNLIETMADVADLLSVEQRKVLEERIQQFHDMRRRWHRG